jgi:hypothetical protein
MPQDRVHTVGSTVQFTKKFLRSIGAGATDPVWRSKGLVVELDPQGWPIVQWLDEPEPRRVHPNNVAVGIYAHID